MAGKTRRATFQDPGGDLFAKYAGIRNRAERCIRFIEAECMVPEGRGTGKPYRLRPYQKRTIRRLLAPGVLVAVLSAPRGWTKSGLAAAIAVTDPTPRTAATAREVCAQPRAEDGICGHTEGWRGHHSEGIVGGIHPFIALAPAEAPGRAVDEAREALTFIAEWANDCADDQPAAAFYGFADIRDRARAALVAHLRRTDHE